MSIAYGLASRSMALVAVVERAGDRAGDVPETVVVPLGMPQDTPFGAYFANTPAPLMFTMSVVPAAPMPSILRQARFSPFSDAPRAPMQPTPPKHTEDLLIELAGRILPDGGMPGASEYDRMMATIMAVMRLVAEGNSLKRGAFRSHVERLLRYLEGLRKPELEQVILAVRAGKALPGNWRTGEPADCPILAQLGLRQ